MPRTSVFPSLRLPVFGRRTRHLSIAAAVAAVLAGQLARAANTILFYDADGIATGDTGAVGGAGTWDATSILWHSGSTVGTLQAYNNATPSTITADFGDLPGTVTIAAGLTINTNSIAFDAAGFTIAGGTALSFTGTTPSVTYSPATAGIETINSVITGTTGLNADLGAGTLLLGGANTFTGGLTLTSGAVQVTTGAQLGGGAINLNGGTLITSQTAQITLSAAQRINVGAAGGTIDNRAAAKLLENTAGGIVGSGTLTRNASANSSSLSNTFQISGANTGFTGAVILNGGITEVSANGLGTGVTPGNFITVNPGAELVAGNSTMNNALTVNGGILSGDNGVSTFAGPITANAAFTIRLGDFFQNVPRNLNINGNLSGFGVFNLIGQQAVTAGAGQTLFLNGDNSNYSGTLNASPGYNLAFATPASMGAGGVVVVVDANGEGGVGVGYDFGNLAPTLILSRSTAAGGVFGLNTSLAATTTIDLSTLGGGGFSLGSQTAGVYNAPTLVADNGVYRLGGGLGTLTVSKGALSGTNALQVGDARANGNGTVVLAGQNTFDGSVTVNNGILSVSSLNSVAGGVASSSLGQPLSVPNGTINLGSGAVAGALRYTGPGESTDRVINLAGTTGAGVIDQSGTGALQFTSPLSVTGSGVKSLTLQGLLLANGEFTSQIANSSLIITKGGANTWLLSGAGNSVQQISISGGVLDIGSQGISALNGGASSVQATGNGVINATGGGTLTVSSLSATDGSNVGAANGFTLTINANVAVTGTGGTLELFSVANGTGVVILNGTNNYSGSTIVNSGVLQVSSIANALGQGTLLSIGNAASTGNTFRYTGAGEVTTKTVNLSATTGAAILDQSGSGVLEFSNPFTATGVGTKTLTLQGSTAGVGQIDGAIVDNNSSTAKTNLLKAGTGTWNLAGASTYSGTTTVNGGNLLLDGTVGSLNPATTVAVATGGNFTYLGSAIGSTQTLGALTMASGEGTISLLNNGGITTLAFASLARTAGASANFVSPVATNGTTSLLTVNNQVTGFINQGTFFNSSNFAYYSGAGASGFVRAPLYDIDPNFVTSAGGTSIGINDATEHVQLNAGAAAQESASVATLKLNGGLAVTQISGATLTIGSGGILATQGASTIAPASGTSTVTGGASEMSIRVDGAGDSLALNSVLAGSGGLTKSGAGTLTLGNSANTFTGNITVNGGTLAFLGTGTSADQISLGAGAKTVTLSNGAILSPLVTSNPTAGTKSFVIGTNGGTFNVANGVTLQLDDAGQFSGTGDLTVTGTGSGAVLLSNQAFTFSGNVFVNSATLRLTANAGVLGAGTGRLLTVASGASVDAQVGTLPLGLVLNGTGVNANGALTNTGTGAATFSGPVTLNAGATIGGTNTGSITLTGVVAGAGLTKTGVNNLFLSGANSYGNTTINGGGVVFNALNSFGAAGPSVTVANGATVGAGFALDQAFLSHLVANTNTFNVALGANSSNDLDFSAAGANLVNASLGATGTFSYTGTLTPNGSTYRVGGGSGVLTLPNSNALTGARNLVVNGGVLLPTSDDLSGSVTINSSGALQLGAGGTVGGLPNVTTIANNGNLIYNRSDDLTTVPFTGTGSLTQASTNRLTIDPTSTGIGRLIFTAAGSVDLGATDRTIGVDGGIGIQMNVAGTATVDASGGAALTIGGANMDVGAAAGGTLIINPVLQGANALDLFNSGSGTVVLNGANTYSGATNLQAVSLTVNSFNSVTTNAALGTTHLSSSTLGAPTTVANGTLNIGNGTSTDLLKYVGSGETTDRVINLAGSTGAVTLDQSGTGLLKFVSNWTATGAGAKTLTLQGTAAAEVDGNIVENSTTNKLTVVKTGTGSWTLAGVNTFTGNVTVNTGALTITNSGGLGTGAKTVSIIPTTNPTSNPSLRLDGTNGDITLGVSLSFTTSFDALNGTAPIANEAAIINLAGNNTIQGAFTLTSGGGGTTFLSNAGMLTISGNLTPSTTNRGINMRGAGNGIISGVLSNGGQTTGLLVAKDAGTGTWTLAGINSYTGATTAGAGTLLVTGSISGSFTTVKTGATFGGTGSTGGVTVNSGGTLAPGDFSGTLATLSTGSVTESSGGHFAFQLGSDSGAGLGTSDAVNVTGAVSLAGDVSISLLGNFANTIGDRFFVILNDGSDAITGGFSNVTGGQLTMADGHVFAVNYADNSSGAGAGNDVSLTLQAVPEPGSLAGLLGGLSCWLGLARFRRRA